MAKPANPPIVLSTVYQYETNEEMRETMLSGLPYFYMRSGNPTVQAVAEEIAALEGAERALLFSSGMAAISCSFFSLLANGDHVLCHSEIFSQTRSLLESVLRKFGVSISYINTRDLALVRASILPSTRLLFVESPSNPSLEIPDIAELGKIVAEHHFLLFVDSTNATPVLQRPLQLGASLVLHSATKFLAGHSDILCGAIAGSNDLVSQIHAIQKLTGGTLDPHAAYLLSRGIKTLELRMRQICASALDLARFLSNHPQIEYVRYPFLPNCPGYQIAQKQMKGGGGIISFELKGGIEHARHMLNALKIVRLATSLGGTETTIEIPYELKRKRDAVEEKMGLIRLSVGIEETADLRKDLEQALGSL